MGRSGTSYVVGVSVVLGLVLAGCDLVDETDAGPTATASPTARRYEGRTLLQVQQAAAGVAGGRCRASVSTACGLDGTTSYALLGAGTRVSLVNAKAVRAGDGTWGVQARFARESAADLADARERAGRAGRALLLLGPGNVVVIEVPTVAGGGAADGRLLVTSGDTEDQALARIGSLTGD